MAPLARQIASIRALGAQVQLLEIIGIPKLKYLQSLPRLWKLASSVDIIHAHYGYCGWLARSQYRRPVVVSFMGDDVLGTPDVEGRVGPVSSTVVQIDRMMARTVDAVIVKSAEMARAIAPVPAHVVPNGVDLRAFRPMDSHDARAELGLAENKHYILFPGCPGEPRKGFSLARTVVATAAPRLNKPSELIPLWGVRPDQVALYMNACDALLMTSFLEGSPNVIKEAMACNLPVVSVPVGDVPELLRGVAGCALCARELDALAGALTSVLPAAQRTNGRVALERKGLDLNSVARKLIKIYEGVLARRA